MDVPEDLAAALVVIAGFHIEAGAHRWTHQ